MIPIQTESAWRGTSDCRNCGIREMVLFADLNEQDFNLIHAPIDDLVYQPGQALYEASDQALGVFTLRKGLIKLVRVTADGRERVVRVLFPGDVVGLEALATGRYDSQAVALNEVSLCRIPLEVVHQLGANSPRLHRKLMEKWQSALKLADDWLAELNFGSARQRVLHFIRKMHEVSEDGSATLFGRDDMGAMMDLKLETVSREVTALVRAGVMTPLDKLGRHYQVLQPELLQEK
ncbi:cyclic nucleotide-binding protein [Limnohabitans sp. Rim8]|jgi:CRP-like cAMP-binding protein|uniref:Cyclic nucleotide-binding protein n=1 Tax=Limnohabitans curvus TaxID=323423 RepID=A0A315ELI7_9BURK|nr:MULTISPECIES: Crp/Fnr family transcriptional regulator [Limnohabitans]PUE58780.1 cyclic nucleotide-binding protein [Limnohabitans curvus]PUE61955.1 cyclic nucleotide-binding protein [Limnohabitans sp. Rim8]